MNRGIWWRERGERERGPNVNMMIVKAGWGISKANRGEERTGRRGLGLGKEAEYTLKERSKTIANESGGDRTNNETVRNIKDLGTPGTVRNHKNSILQVFDFDPWPMMRFQGWSSKGKSFGTPFSMPFTKRPPIQACAHFFSLWAASLQLIGCTFS